MALAKLPLVKKSSSEFNVLGEVTLVSNFNLVHKVETILNLQHQQLQGFEKIICPKSALALGTYASLFDEGGGHCVSVFPQSFLSRCNA